MKQIYITIILLVYSLFSLAQTKQVLTSYDRNSVSVLLLDADQKYDKQLLEFMDQLSISDKYDFNPIAVKTIHSNANQLNIMNKLISEKIAAKSLMNWRSTSTLIQRANYNLTDNEVNQLEASSRGIEGVKDERWFKQLLHNNFIMVIKLHGIVTMESVYDKRDALNTGLSLLQGGSASAYTKRSREGYKGNASVYLYRIEMNELDYSSFWKNWNADQQHMNYDFKIKFVAQAELKTDGTQFKGEFNRDLINRLLNKSIDASLQKLGVVYPPFAAKTTLLSTRPLQAKIGKKEGLKSDQLFFVNETIENRKGELLIKRKGVVRAKKVADNRSMATGSSKTSTFYKVSQGSYTEGMMLYPKKDAGFSLLVGSVISPESMPKIRLSYNLSKFVNTNNFTQFKLFVEGGISTKKTDNNSLFADYEALSAHFADKGANKLFTYFYGVGLEKDIFILPFIQFKPFLGAYIEKMVYSNDDQIYALAGSYELPENYGELFYLQGGVRFPFNLNYNIKIVPSVSYSTRNNENTTGIGAAPTFSDYPKYIVNDNKITYEIMLRFDF